MDLFYKLVDKKPVACTPMEQTTCNRWPDWRVAKDFIGDYEISTVFLGVKMHEKIPCLFETMIFTKDDNWLHNRADTWEEAEKMHKEACDFYKEKISVSE